MSAEPQPDNRSVLRASVGAGSQLTPLEALGERVLEELVQTARERAGDYHLPEDLDLPEGVLDQLRALGYVDEH